MASDEEAQAGCYQCSDCFFVSADLTIFLNHECPFAGQSSIGGVVNNPASLTVPTAESGSQLTNISLNVTSMLTHWDDNDIKLLIDSYNKHKHLFKKGKTTKKVVFEHVAQYFNSNSPNVSVTGDQCQRKWNKLEQSFKSIEDNNRNTGRERKDWKFFDAMTDCMGNSPKVNPVYCLDTSAASAPSPSSAAATYSSASSASCSTDAVSSDSDTESGSDASKVKKGVRRRKRKGRSSASEMLDFLREYSEKREKAEEQKVAVLKEMHEEKKNFFSEFLQVMKNKK